jgi:hypothetical protein
MFSLSLIAGTFLVGKHPTNAVLVLFLSTISGKESHHITVVTFSCFILHQFLGISYIFCTFHLITTILAETFKFLPRVTWRLISLHASSLTPAYCIYFVFFFVSLVYVEPLYYTLLLFFYCVAVQSVASSSSGTALVQTSRFLCPSSLFIVLCFCSGPIVLPVSHMRYLG